MPSMSNKTRLVTLTLILILITTTASSALASRPGATATIEGPVVARVYFASLADLNQLATRLDVWEVHHAAGYLVALLRPGETTALRQAGYRVEIEAEKTADLGRPHEPIPGQVSGIRGDAQDVFSRGFVCPKGAALKPLHEEAHKLISGFDYFVVEAVPRKLTRGADKLANAALDKRSAISRQPSAKMRSPAASPEPSRRAPAAGTIRIRAVYQNGVLKPVESLDLPDGTEVELTVHPPTKG